MQRQNYMLMFVLAASYIAQAQAGSQGVYDVLSKVRVIRVPNQTDGDDLRAVEEDPSHPELLTTLTLRRRRSNIDTKHLRNCNRRMFGLINNR